MRNSTVEALGCSILDAINYYKASDKDLTDEEVREALSSVTFYVELESLNNKLDADIFEFIEESKREDLVYEH